MMPGAQPASFMSLPEVQASVCARPSSFNIIGRLKIWMGEQMRTKLSLAFAIGVMCVCSFAARQADAQDNPHHEHAPHIFAPKGSPRNTRKNLIDHGGLVLPTSNVHAIFWGDWNTSSSDIPNALDDFFNGFGGSNYANILTQYMRGGTPKGGPPVSNYIIEVPDSSAPPTHSPPVSTIVNEACMAVGAGAPDPAGVYFVITSNFPKGASFCAWHSDGTCNGAPIAVTYLPNVTGVKGCGVPSTLSNGFSAGAQAMANVAAHELSESITDPLLNAWFDQSGQEVGDKCAFQFGSPVTLGETAWVLQEEWSNANFGCVQSIP